MGEDKGEAPVIEAVNENAKALEQFIVAKFHFVDLAGSERVSRTGNRGERFKGTYMYGTLLTSTKRRNLKEPCLLVVRETKGDYVVLLNCAVVYTDSLA